MGFAAARMIGTADAATLQAAAQAASTEIRTRVEAGQPVAPADAVALGRAIGERHWLLGRRACDLANVSHFAALGRLRAAIAAARTMETADSADAVDTHRTAASDRVRNLLDLCTAALEDAARGATGLTFPDDMSSPEPSGRSSHNPIRVIVTGFDPFNTSDVDAPVRPGDWNPSGAAALALDGAEVAGADGAQALVRSLVLPVDRLAFGEADGVVERYIRPHADEVDAVLTVSLDRHLGRADAARLERFAAGVRSLDRGRRLIRVPGGGAPLLEASDLVDAVAAGAAEAAGRRDGIRVPAPVVRNEITLKFDDPAAAARLRRRLGLELPASDSVGGGSEVVIDGAGTVRSIAASARRTDASIASIASIEFRCGGEMFSARLVRGPGGNFLSNEVSYRVIRLLSRTAAGRTPASFHTHIPGCADVDLRSTELGHRVATRRAHEQRAYAIATVRRVVAATATEIAVRRRSHRPST